MSKKRDKKETKKAKKKLEKKLAKKAEKSKKAKKPAAVTITHCNGCKKHCPLVKPKCGTGKKLAKKLGIKRK